MSSQYDLTIEQGSSFNVALTAQDSTGLALNLSGYGVSGQIRYGYGSTGVMMNLTTSIDPSFVSGLINTSLTATQTSSLPITKAVYDIEVYGTGGYTFKVIKGYADISPEVTR